MKKLTNKTLQRRKLIVRRETIASLTIPQLHQAVAGGAGTTMEACGTYTFYWCETEIA